MRCVNCGGAMPVPTPDPFRCPECRRPAKRDTSWHVRDDDGFLFRIVSGNGETIAYVPLDPLLVGGDRLSNARLLAAAPKLLAALKALVSLLNDDLDHEQAAAWDAGRAAIAEAEGQS